MGRLVSEKMELVLELYFMEIDDEGAERDGSEARGGIRNTGLLLCFGFFFRAFSKLEGEAGRVRKCTRSCND